MLELHDSSATAISGTAQILRLDESREGSLPPPTMLTCGDISTGTQEEERFRREPGTEAFAIASPRAGTKAELRENRCSEPEGALVGDVEAGHGPKEDTRQQHPPKRTTGPLLAHEEGQVSPIPREVTPDENTNTGTSAPELTRVPQNVVPVDSGSRDDKRTVVSGEPPTAMTPEEIPPTFTAIGTSGKGAIAPSDAACVGGRQSLPPEEVVTEKYIVPPLGQLPRRESTPGDSEVSSPAVAREVGFINEHGDVTSTDEAEERGVVVEIANHSEGRTGDVAPSRLATLDDGRDTNIEKDRVHERYFETTGVFEPVAGTDRPQTSVRTSLAVEKTGQETSVAIMVAETPAESAMNSPAVSVENRIATDYANDVFASPIILALTKAALSVEGTSTPEPASRTTQQEESNASSNVLSAIRQGSGTVAVLSPSAQQPPESSHSPSAPNHDHRDDDIVVGKDRSSGSVRTDDPTGMLCFSVETRVRENGSLPPKQTDSRDAETMPPSPLGDESSTPKRVGGSLPGDAKTDSSQCAALTEGENGDAAAARAQTLATALGSGLLVVASALENQDAGVRVNGVRSSLATAEAQALIEEAISLSLVAAAAVVAGTARDETKPTGDIFSPPSMRYVDSVRSLTLCSSVNDIGDGLDVDEGCGDGGRALSIDNTPTPIYTNASTTIEARVVADYLDQIVRDILNQIIRDTAMATTSTRHISSTSTSRLDNEPRNCLQKPFSKEVNNQTVVEPPTLSARAVESSNSVTFFSSVEHKGEESSAQEGIKNGDDNHSIETTPASVFLHVPVSVEERAVADYLEHVVRSTVVNAITSTGDCSHTSATRLDIDSTKYLNTLCSTGARCQGKAAPPQPSAKFIESSRSVTLYSPGEDKQGDYTVKGGSDGGGCALVIDSMPTSACSHVSTAIEARVVADYLHKFVRNYVNKIIRDAAAATKSTGDVAATNARRLDNEPITCVRASLPSKEARYQADAEPLLLSAKPVGSSASVTLCTPAEDKRGDYTFTGGSDGRGCTLIIESTPTPACTHASIAVVSTRVVADYLDQGFRDAATAAAQQTPSGAVIGVTPGNTVGTTLKSQPKTPTISTTSAMSHDVNVPADGSGTRIVKDPPTAVYPHDPTGLEARVVADYLNQVVRGVVTVEDRSASGTVNIITPQDIGAGSPRLPSMQTASPTSSEDMNLRILPEGEPPTVVSTTPTTVAIVGVHDPPGAEMQSTDIKSINNPPNERASSSSSRSLEARVMGDYVSEAFCRVATAEAEAFNAVRSEARNLLCGPPAVIDDEQLLVTKVGDMDGDGNRKPPLFVPVNDLGLPTDASEVVDTQPGACTSRRNSNPRSPTSARTEVFIDDFSNRVEDAVSGEETAVTARVPCSTRVEGSAVAEPGEPVLGSGMVVPALDVPGEPVTVLSVGNVAVICADGDLGTLASGIKSIQDGGNPLALITATHDGGDGDKVRADDDSIGVTASSNSGDCGKKTQPEPISKDDHTSMVVDDADKVFSTPTTALLGAAVVADYLSDAFVRSLHAATTTTPAPCTVSSALGVSRAMLASSLASPTLPGTSREGEKGLERELDSRVEDAESWPCEAVRTEMKIASSSIKKTGAGEEAELTTIAITAELNRKREREPDIKNGDEQTNKPFTRRSVEALPRFQEGESQHQSQQVSVESRKVDADVGATPPAREEDELAWEANKPNPIDDRGQAPRQSVEIVLHVAGGAQGNCRQGYTEGVNVDVGVGFAVRGTDELEREAKKRNLAEDGAPPSPRPPVEAFPLKSGAHIDSQQGGVAEVNSNEASGLAARGMAKLERTRSSEALSVGGLSRPSSQPQLGERSKDKEELASSAVAAAMGEEQATPAPTNSNEGTATPCPTVVLGKTVDGIVTEVSPLTQGGNPALGCDGVPFFDRSPSADRTAPAPWIDPTATTTNAPTQRAFRQDTNHSVVPTTEPTTDLRRMLEAGENEWTRVSLSRTPPFDALNSPSPALRWVPVGHAGVSALHSPQVPATTAAAAEIITTGGAEVADITATQQPAERETTADGSPATTNDNRGPEWESFFAPPHRMAPTGDAYVVDGFRSAEASPGSTIHGDSTPGGDCFLSSLHVPAGGYDDERRDFRWSGNGDDDETASEESWGVLGRVQNPPDEAHRRMMMRNTRAGACLVDEGGGEAGRWGWDVEGGLVESRTLGSSGTPSLKKKSSSRKRWNKAAERSRLYTRKWEVFLSQAGRYFEGEAQVRKRLSVICRAHPDVTNEIAFVALAQCRGRAPEAAAILHLRRAKDEAALVSMLLDVTEFINAAREVAEERRRGARAQRRGVVEEEQQQQEQRLHRPHPRQQRHHVPQHISGGGGGGNFQQQEEPPASRYYSQHHHHHHAQQGQRPRDHQRRGQQKRLRHREESDEEEEDSFLCLDANLRDDGGNDGGDSSYSRCGDNGNGGVNSEGDVVAEQSSVVGRRRRQQQLGIDGRAKGRRTKGERGNSGLQPHRGSASAPALLPPLARELTADGTPPTPNTLKTVLATSTSMALNIPKGFGLIPPEVAVQTQWQDTRTPARKHGTGVAKGERPTLRVRARLQRQRMAEMSAPGGGGDTHGLDVDVLVQRTILEMCTLDRDSHHLDARFRESTRRGPASLGGWGERKGKGQRRGESTSKRRTISSSKCLASLNNSSTNSGGGNNNDATLGKGRDGGSCRVQSYFTQTLGDARRHAGAM